MKKHMSREDYHYYRGVLDMFVLLAHGNHDQVIKEIMPSVGINDLIRAAKEQEDAAALMYLGQYGYLDQDVIL